MIKKISDVATLFYEDNQVIGLLHINGQTQFYTVRPANKAEIDHLLETERAEDK